MENREFDEFAGNYREIHTQNVQGVSGQDSDYFSEYKICELASRKIIAENAAWLDLGCGDGNTAVFIRKYFPEASYSGIDVSEESINMAEAREDISPDYTFTAYDGQHIPFEDDTFDVIFIACVLHHVMPEQRPALMTECRRVLKSSGKLIIFEHNPYNPVTMKLVNTCPFDANAQLLTYPVTKELLTSTGFRIIKKRYTIFIPRKGFLEKLTGIEKLLTWLPMGGQYYVVAGK